MMSNKDGLPELPPEASNPRLNQHGGIPSRHRKNTEIFQRRAMVAEMFLHHANELEIATALKTSKSVISRDLKVLRSVWYADAMRDMREHKSRLIAELDAIVEECTVHLHNKDRDRSLDSQWITQWRVTLLERAKVLGLLEQKTALDITSNGRTIGVREVIIEMPSGTFESGII